MKSTTYYFSCLYEEAKTALAAYDELYAPMAEKLKPIVEGADAEPAMFFKLVDSKRRRSSGYAVAERRAGRPGSFPANVTVVYADRADALKLPNAALQVPSGEGGGGNARCRPPLLGLIQERRLIMGARHG